MKRTLKLYCRLRHLAGALLWFCTATLLGQTVIEGVVRYPDGEEAIGVQVILVGTSVHAITDASGTYQVKTDSVGPLTLEIRQMSYKTVTREFPSGTSSTWDVTLEESPYLLEGVEVRAFRIPERIQELPSTVEALTHIQIRFAPSYDFYDEVSNLKGVNTYTSSINFPAISPRGFAKPNNNRFVQLIDGMDNSAPLLNFSVGNIVGISELDMASAELIPGAASALYGPNAFNGILMMRSKNPFDSPGLSAQVKFGINDADNFDSPQPLYQAGIRYALQIIPDRLAIKLNASYMRASDWRATDYSTGVKTAINPAGSEPGDPNFDAMNAYGDETQIYVPEGFVCPTCPAFDLRRTGFKEQDLLADNDASSLKFDGAIHYRFGGSNELSYNFRYGRGSAVYQGGERYALRDFTFKMQKVELTGKRYNLRAYMTHTDDGDSYNLTALGGMANEAFKPSEQWFGEYATAFLGSVAEGMTPDKAHSVARDFADQGIPQPGTPGFQGTLEALRAGNLQSDPLGAGFIDDSKMYHVEGNYSLPELISGMDVMVGGNYRLYDLFSDGTVFNENPDGEGKNERITNSEFGAFVQVRQRALDDRLRMTGSIRYDKNENFDGQVSPRLAAVYLAGRERQHAFRASFQTGFRNPSNQEQFIYFEFPTGILIGGTEENASSLGIYEGNSYTNASWQLFLQTQDPAVLEMADIDYVKPERVQVYEVGYKSMINHKLHVDMNVYHSRYRDFVSQQTVVLQETVQFKGREFPGADQFPDRLPQVFRAYTNSRSRITSTGFGFGLDYNFIHDYSLYGHYSYTTYSAEDVEPDFDPSFNRPEHMFLVGMRNQDAWNGLGFNVHYRWQDAYEWESAFGYGTVDAFGSLDASLTYKLSKINTTIKVGSTNILGNDYRNILGGPTIGRTAFVGLTYGLN